MTEVSQLSIIINKLEVSHDKRKSAMNNYAKKSILNLIDKHNTDLN